MLPRFGIRGKLLSSIILILLLSYATLVYVTIKSLYASLEEDIGKDLETNLRFVQGQYMSRADTVMYSSMQLASDETLRSRLMARDKPWLRDKLQQGYRNFPIIDFLTVVDADKRVVARGFSEISGDVYELKEVIDRSLAEMKPVVSTELVPGTMLCSEGKTNYCDRLSTGEAMLVVVVVPILSPDKVPLGAVIAGDILNDAPHLPFKVRGFVGQELEVAISQGDKRISSNLAEESPLPATITKNIMAKLKSGLPFRGEAAFGVKSYETLFEPIRNIRGDVIGSLSVAVSKEYVKRIRRDNLRNILASVTVGIILSFVVAYFVARRLTGPLRELTAGVRMVESGELSQRVNISQKDEVGMLANSFNSMAESLLERDRIIKGKTGELQRLNEQLEKNVADRTSELRMEMGKLEAILTSMAEGIVVTDSSYRVILCNPAAQKIFDLVPHRILYQPLEGICDAPDFRMLVEGIRKMGESEEHPPIREGEAFVKGKRLRTNISPLLDDRGAFAGAVMSIRDTTVEDEVDRMKTEFISTVSHELKTPLTSMKGSLQFILTKGKWLTETERELLHICMRNTERLIRLINDILDISKIEAGKVEFSMGALSIGELVVYAIEEISGFAMNRNIAILNDLESDLPQAYGDHDRLIQVLTNLLSNAVKFSPEGKSVMVTARREGDFVAVSVADQGKAILWSDREKLFKKFQQLHSVGEVSGGGTGLGLTICKEIIERHHGRIYYQESVTGGNVFTFTVPVYGEF